MTMTVSKNLERVNVRTNFLGFNFENTVNYSISFDTDFFLYKKDTIFCFYKYNIFFIHNHQSLTDDNLTIKLFCVEFTKKHIINKSEIKNIVNIFIAKYKLFECYTITRS